MENNHKKFYYKTHILPSNCSSNINLNNYKNTAVTIFLFCFLIALIYFYHTTSRLKNRYHIKLLLKKYTQFHKSFVSASEPLA